ncbi:MAG TPA: hypothetical protein VF092_15070 [Longimicrobium sp.]
MKKLRLDHLAVESFATIARAGGIRGTVVGRVDTSPAACPNTDPPYCPDSWGGTCWISCWDTCPCTGGPDCA